MLPGGGGGGGGGGGRGKGPAGAALRSAAAAPAVWRRTGAAGAPPAGARSHRGAHPAAAPRPGTLRPGARRTPRRRRFGACAARAGRRGGEGPTRLPSARPGFSPWRWSLGGRRHQQARWSPSRAEPEPPPPPRAAPRLPPSAPAGVWGAAGRGAMAGGGRALGLAPKTGPSSARDEKTGTLTDQVSFSRLHSQ
ncbi:homeobox protein Hox-D11-like [Equus przewalskii]|uniref:Homeobox protein Hox-D11-like n=1 Tax=Equus przewalskii TaxID=9798 RepID=A0ABM4KZJ8_EQUPR